MQLISLKSVRGFKFKKKRNYICALFGRFTAEDRNFTISGVSSCVVCVFERQNWFISHRDMPLVNLVGITLN
jgi:hypothetical protein